MNDELLMHRCLGLAEMGKGLTTPNPMVGALLVHEDKIIGEGYHRAYGEAHAEKNAIADAIARGNVDLIHQSTLFVSLEPCSHFGKTGPCTELIIQCRIPKVVIGSRDPNKEVSGNGVEKLREAGVEVETGLLENECIQLNKNYFTFHEKKRPYIVLKWAETGDGFIASSNQSRLLISDEFANRIVHRWRSEEASILVGTSTVEMDDPQLTTRLWPGHSPIRLIIDMDLRLSPTLKVFDRSVPTIVFNTKRHSDCGDWNIYPRRNGANSQLLYWQVTNEASLVQQLTNALYHLKIQSVIVEGGLRLIQSFIDEGTWDEARRITNRGLIIGKGLRAPILPQSKKEEEVIVMDQKIEWLKPSDQL